MDKIDEIRERAKMAKSKETDLAKPVANWLRSKGYTVYSEVPYWHRCIDMIGFKAGKIRIVELKVRYSKGGVKQAVLSQLATSDVYLAVSNNPKPKSIELCKKYGVGLLRVTEQVEILNWPCKVVELWSGATKHLIENCLATMPSDKAGIACMSGCGPAQAVAACIQQYVDEHPKARWREIFKNVPNHYSNHKSIACAMSGYIGKGLADFRAKGKNGAN